jgi:hypothetical protein
MCGRLASELRYCSTAPDLISYWRDRFNWTESQVALVDLLGTQKAIAKLSPAAQRRVQELRCGWLPVNWRVSREDPDCLNGCTACSHGNLVEETEDHIFQYPHQSRRTAMLGGLAGVSKEFRPWRACKTLINALHSGFLARIRRREVPDVEQISLG